MAHVTMMPPGWLGHDMEVTFSRDLKHGKEAERLLGYILGTRCNFEVKRDEQAYETGNVFIEVRGNAGQPSGLTTTTADHWVIAIDGPDGIMRCLVTVSVPRLLELVRGRKEVQGKEGSYGHLLPVWSLTGTPAAATYRRRAKGTLNGAGHSG